MSCNLFYKILFYVLLLFGTATAWSQNKIKWSSWDTAPDKIEEGNKKFLIYFYYDGCRWCRFMEDNTFSADHIARFVNLNFHPYKVNALSRETIVADKSYTSVRVGKYEFHELATEMLAGNMSFPSVVFLDEQFHKLGSYDSYMDISSFEMILSYYAGDHHKRTMWKRFANNYCRDSHFNALVNDKNKH
jgi:thioredoxin-related protein